jgi:hemerythrin-like domain-containing protein
MTSMAQKRSRELRPLSSEHHQALLVAFQLKKGLAGHSESAGAPKDLPGLLALARRFEDSVFIAHTKAEEELLGEHLAGPDMRRLTFEHAEMIRLLDLARTARPGDLRQALTSFAELLERHIRWEERELFPSCEHALGEDVLATIGHELEKRLVTRSEKQPKRA